MSKAVVKNLPANAGDTGSISCLGRPLHAVKQLSLCTTNTEPVLYSPGTTLLSPCTATIEAHEL